MSGRNISDDATMRPSKDAVQERPIPDVWRPTLTALVASLSQQDGIPLGEDVPGVTPAAADLSVACREAVRTYGDVTLLPLPASVWDTSICLWQGTHWQCLVDLWTEEEGRSDLVLDVDVVEHGEDDYRFSVNLVYVP